MKFDIFSWAEAPSNKITIEGGRIRLKTSAPCAFYAECEGYEALAGYGTELDITVAGVVTVTADGPEGVRVFLFEPMSKVVMSDGEVFTNADRQPMESGNLFEVRREMRLFALERKAMLDEMREHRRKLRTEKPVEEPAKEPVKEPAKEPETPEGDDGE